MLRCYSELLQIPTFKERYEYLRLDGVVGEETQASRSLGIIGSDTVVKVCNDESVSGFYKVKTVDGISGYCMSEFIKLC